MIKICLHIKLVVLLFVSASLLSFTASVFAQNCEIGAFVGNGDHRAPSASEIQNFENLAGRHVNSVLFYWSWNDGDFPAADLNSGIRYHDGYDTQTSLNLTWEPWSRSQTADPYPLQEISSGNHDNYITKFAQDCRDWQAPIRLRFAHEMIDDNNPDTPGWYPWQDRPAEYIQAWDHVYEIFQDEGADNVEFVWAPNHHSTDLGVLSSYYPGKDKVDWLGIDGYNWGYYDQQHPWGYWLTFDQVFEDIYNVMVDNPEIFGDDKKMMLGEFASAQLSAIVGKTKEDWINDAFSKIESQYSEIDAFYWFNIFKERDWRIDSSPESLLAFQQAIQDPYFTSHMVPEPATIMLFGTGFVYMLVNLNKNKSEERG